MEKYPLPMSGRGYRTNRGDLRLWIPGAGFLVAQLGGEGDGELADPIVRAFDDVLKAAPAAHVFFDVEHLRGYQSRLRTTLTTRFQHDRLRLRTLSVLVGSKLVAMGVSVANLALGGIVSVHSRRERFVSHLQTTLSGERITGFSVDVLGPVRARR